MWFALGANRANGHQMTPADKRHAILLADAAWPERSSRQIAEQIGCNQNYVSEVRRQVSATTHLSGRVTGKDGKSYPASRRTEPSMELTGDKTKDTLLAIQTYPEKSGREIAAMVGVDPRVRSSGRRGEFLRREAS